MQREDTLDAFAVTDAADRKSGVEAASPPANDDPGENLDALFVAFHDLGVDAHGITDFEFCRIFPKLFGFNFVKQCLAHKLCSFFCFCNKSGLRCAVRALACSARHWAISAWLPDNNTSGTRIPRNSAGRVYCGYSSKPWLNDSSAALCSSPNTPGSNRVTASISTMAGKPPLVST